MSQAFSLTNENNQNNNNDISSGREGLFPTIAFCVQAPVENETQKLSLWEKIPEWFCLGGGSLFHTVLQRK